MERSNGLDARDWLRSVRDGEMEIVDRVERVWVSSSVSRSDFMFWLAVMPRME